MGSNKLISIEFYLMMRCFLLSSRKKNLPFSTIVIFYLQSFNDQSIFTESYSHEFFGNIFTKKPEFFPILNENHIIALKCNISIFSIFLSS